MTDAAGHLQSRWTRVDGLTLHAKVSIDPVPPGRLPLVMVHGLLVSSRYMLAAGVLLAPRFPVYAVDLPGYGKSDKPRATQEIPCLSAILDRWMGALGLERAAVIANSFGCQVATDFALRYPERVARLVLVGPTVDRHHHSALQQTTRLLLDGTREPLTYERIIGLDLWDMGPRRALRMAGVCLRDYIEERLPRIEVPTLVVRGERDPLVPQQWAEEVAAMLPKGRLVVVPGAAHVAHYDAADRFVALVQPFLGGEGSSQ